MDFSDPITKQYLIALMTITAGLAGWLLPDKYNVLKLKARYAKYVSERTNILIARTLGEFAQSNADFREHRREKYLAMGRSL